MANSNAKATARPGDLFEADDPALQQLSVLATGWDDPLDPSVPQHALALALARDLRAAGFELHQVTMNYALADVLTALGWKVEQYGQASAHIVREPAPAPSEEGPRDG